MIPEKMFHQIMALGDSWRVSGVEYVEKESKVLIRVEETPELWRTEGPTDDENSKLRFLPGLQIQST